MIGAGLLARKAVQLGLRVPAYVKTSFAPGSKVVTQYLDRAGLSPYLEALGFHLVGYGCTTCIGNSGPLNPVISSAVLENDLTVVSVLSGNRNFEGRIHPEVKANYLASPPLVVAYALAGTMDIDLATRAARQGPQRKPRVPEGHLADSRGDRCGGQGKPHAGDVPLRLRERLQRGRDVEPREDPGREALPLGTGLDLYPQAHFLRRPGEPAAGDSADTQCAGPGGPGRFGDNGPHLSRGEHPGEEPGREMAHGARRESPGLQHVRLPPGKPRGDDPRHLCQHPHPQQARARRGGRIHPAPPVRRRPFRSSTRRKSTGQKGCPSW